MRTMTDHRIDERMQAVHEADVNAMHEGAADRLTRSGSVERQKDMPMQKNAQNGAQPAKRRRNRSIGKKAMLIYKINERLLRLNNYHLQVLLIYACMLKAAQAIQRLKKFEPKKAAKASK